MTYIAEGKTPLTLKFIMKIKPGQMHIHAKLLERYYFL